MKKLLHRENLTLQKITETTLLNAVVEMYNAATILADQVFNIDDFDDINEKVINVQEHHYQSCQTYKVLSFISVILLDLGLISIDV